jgi:threonine/homoserine/homoserine lactone efflux protein
VAVPSGAHLLAFALPSLALIVVPGPNVLFVISRSLQLGRAAGVGTAGLVMIGIGASLALSGRAD